MKQTLFTRYEHMFLITINSRHDIAMSFYTYVSITHFCK